MARSQRRAQTKVSSNESCLDVPGDAFLLSCLVVRSISSIWMKFQRLTFSGPSSSVIRIPYLNLFSAPCRRKSRLNSWSPLEAEKDSGHCYLWS
ncbi:hypothetical protein V3C99_014977 [Haemonchus contortus]